MTPPIFPIGTSLLQYLDLSDDEYMEVYGSTTIEGNNNNNNNNNNDRSMNIINNKQQFSTTQPPAILRPPPSTHRNNNINDVDQSNNTTTNHNSSRNTIRNQNNYDPSRSKRMVLQGPEKSGRTSIAMDLAYSIASSTPCRCLQPNNCSCIAVTYFLPMKKPPQPNTDGFPLLCQHVELLNNNVPVDEKNNSNNSNNHQQEKQQQEKKQFDYINQQTGEQMKQFIEKTKEEKWDDRQHVLKRIRIIHIICLEDVIEYLVTIHTKDQSEQPCGAIIIDDFDVLTLEPIEIMEILAIINDTANTLWRTFGIRPTILIIVETDRRIIIPWMTTLISLVPKHEILDQLLRCCYCSNTDDVSSSSSSNNNNENLLHHYLLWKKELVIASSWIAHFQDLYELTTSGRPAPNYYNVEYAITKYPDTIDNNLCIHWMTLPLFEK